MNAIAKATAPGPANARPRVPATQTTVETKSSFFLAACASAQAPTSGPATITIA